MSGSLSLRAEQLAKVPSAVDHTEDSDIFFVKAVRNHVRIHTPKAVARKFHIGTGVPHTGHSLQISNCAIKCFPHLIRCRHTVLGDEVPNLEEVQTRLRLNEQLSHPA